MRQSQRSGGWWKIGSVVLVLFASIIALRTPLAPALVHVEPDRIKAGEVTLVITGYGTHFTKSEEQFFVAIDSTHAPATIVTHGEKQGPLAWLVNDHQRLCSSSIFVLSDARLSAQFQVPGGFRKELTTLFVRSPQDGELVMLDALWTEDRGAGIEEQPCSGLPPNAEHLTTKYSFPNRNILYETIRNLNFHVPMWFTMIVLMGISFWFSLIALRQNNLDADLAAEVAAKTGLLFCALGLITGSIWARFTWGAWWTTDAKLNGAAVGTLIYLAYLVLRGSVPEAHKRMRLAAVYNIFAFSLLIVLLFVLPRLVDSLHPGNGGNPAFSNYDLDNRLRMVFYPAVLGWIGIGVWLFTLGRRMARLQHLLDR